MTNVEIRRFEMSLVSLYNKSPAPVEAKRLALLEVLHRAEVASQNVISQELKENEEATKDE